jgi:hypothetical protein
MRCSPFFYPGNLPLCNIGNNIVHSLNTTLRECQLMLSPQPQLSIGEYDKGKV